MRLLTWNVNGIRALAKKGLEQILDYLGADIVCFQETKATEDQIELNEDLYPYQYAFSAQKKGYSGVMIASQYEATRVVKGIGIEEFDAEGRVITAYFGNFAVVCVYVPNSQDGLKRIDYRMRFDEAFGEYLRSIDVPVLVCGDFNVARTAQDIWDEADGIGSAGYSEQEKNSFEKNYLSTFEDVYRKLKPEGHDYSWWSYKSGGRARNEGWRIDYWLVSKDLLDKVQDIKILGDVFGSDHCPVMLNIRLKPES